jgi:hypothetical protein
VTFAAGMLFLAIQPVQAQDDKDAIIQQLKATIERQQKELESLKKVVKEREVVIVSLEAKLKETVNAALNHETQVKIRQAQNETLLEQVRELTKALARLEAGKQPGGVDAPATAPNPPPNKVEGKVEKIKGDLIMINIGSDSGLKKDHTLEVFRLDPEPAYLGMIRIVEVNEKSAVGRMVAAANAKNRRMPKEGDRVASSLTR